VARSTELLLVAFLLLTPAVTRAQEGTAPVGSKTAPLPEPPAECAKLLAVFDKDPEPQREVKRLYAQALYYLLDRNLERYLLCFHEDFELDESGTVSKLSPAQLKARVVALWEKTPRSTLKLEELVELGKARAYTRDQAKRWIGDWKKEPSEIARVMKEGDMLVIAPLTAKARGGDRSDFEAELFFVFRKQDDVWKIALGE
jgi:hypothetical protein